MRMRLSKKALVGIGASWVAYVVITTLLGNPPGNRQLGDKVGLYGISFGFGPVIENLCKYGRYEDYFYAAGGSIGFTCHRMLLIPYGMAALAKIHNSLLLGLIVKNALCGLLIVWGAVRLLGDCPRVSRLLLFLAAVFAVTCPKLMFFNASLDFEEGYLISMMFLLFVYLAGHCAKSDAVNAKDFTWVLLALVNAAMFLTKSSMLYLTVVNCVLVYFCTRKWRLFAYFGGALGIALLAWALHNYQQSGRFTISNSFDWYNVYRGNCPRTDEMYPHKTLDLLDREGYVRAPPGITDEWAYDRHWKEQTLRFARENPGVIAKVAAKKLYVMLLDVKSSPYLPEKAGLAKLIDTINIPYMVLYRAILIPMLVLAVISIVRRPHGDSRVSELRRLSVVFLASFAAYTFSYVVGFAWQRHALPLMPLVLVFAIHVVHARRVALESLNDRGPAK